MSKLDNYSNEKFEQLVKEAKSYRDLVLKLGYATNSSSVYEAVKKRVLENNLDTSHFSSIQGVKRTEENVFCENSTAHQKTLREWFVKGEYQKYICSICNQPPEWQGKPLTLILDHINGNNKDNRLENLRWVCPNCNQQLDTTGFKIMRSKKEKHYCIDCGIEISSKATRCQTCYAKSRLTELPVSREELKILIRTTSFVQIGQKFQVSDNAIRKWCDKYNLPRKKTEIQKYSEEEWLKI